jgi:hypothetical protein
MEFLGGNSLPIPPHKIPLNILQLWHSNFPIKMCNLQFQCRKIATINIIPNQELFLHQLPSIIDVFVSRLRSLFDMQRFLDHDYS